MSDDPSRDDRAHWPLAAAILSTLPLLLKLFAAILVIAMGIAIALGKIGVMIGALGMGGALALAVVSAVVQRQKLRRAMRESDLP